MITTKCIKHALNGRIERVTDTEAAKAVESGSWKYCPKKEWKATKLEDK